MCLFIKLYIFLKTCEIVWKKVKLTKIEFKDQNFHKIELI